MNEKTELPEPEKAILVEGWHDSLLYGLITAVNAAGELDGAKKIEGIGVTLLIKGAVVSGDLIAKTEYKKALYEFLKSSPLPEGSFSLIETSLDSSYKAQEEYIRTHKRRTHKMIHLKSVQILQGGQTITSAPIRVPMRILLDEVDGFILGKLS
jgi:hypothetical protein